MHPLCELDVFWWKLDIAAGNFTLFAAVDEDPGKVVLRNLEDSPPSLFMQA